MATLTEVVGRSAAYTARTLRATWHAATYPYRVTVRAARRTGHRMALAFRESYGPEILVSPGTGIDADDWQYRRLSRSARDLQPLNQERQLEQAHYLWAANPVARRVLEMTKDFVLGDGATLHTDRRIDPAVLEHARRFWDDPVNDLETFQDELCLELAKAGEVVVPAFVNPQNGHVHLGWLDPASVAAVMTDPANCRRPLAVKVKKGTGYEYLYVIREEDPADSADDRGGTLAVAPTGEGAGILDPSVSTTQVQPYAGSCLLFQINKSPSASRGTSDLLPLCDWLDAFDGALWSALDRIGFLNAFVWDVTKQGASQAEIDAYLAEQLKSPPKPGSIRVHNEKVAWTAVTPDLKMGDFSEGNKTFLNQIMGGAGLPSHWYGANDDVNKASGESMSEPVLKRLTKRQKVIRRLLLTLVRFAIDQAVLAGQLDDAYPILDDEGQPTTETIRARDAVDVLLPELSAKDTGRLAAALLQTAQALEVAVAQGLVSEARAREAFAAVLAQLGVEVDLDAEREAIEQERQAREQEQAERMAAQQAQMAQDRSQAAGGQNGAVGQNGAARNGRAALALVPGSN